MMSTKVYHVTYFSHGGSAYLHFLSCNFSCKGCIRRLSMWDTHLPKSIRSLLDSSYKRLDNILLKLESLESLLKMLNDVYGLKSAVLGGGEPTSDPSLREVLNTLYDYVDTVTILSNGYELDRFVNVIDRGRVRIVVSVKSFDKEKHQLYTGWDLDRVLTNIELLYGSGFNVSVETLMIPGLNDIEDIEKLAQYLSRRLDDRVTLIIDSYVNVPNAPWRSPTVEELRKSEEVARRYVKNVYARAPNISRPIGDIYLVYPYLRLPLSDNFSL